MERFLPAPVVTWRTQLRLRSMPCLASVLKRKWIAPFSDASGRKGQRGEFKIGLAKTFPPDTGPYRRARQNHPNRAESKREKERWDWRCARV